MMTQPSRIHLFQGYGIELEYMIVNRDTLELMPISDELLKQELGEYGSDFENGIVSWSNELVLHVIEIKSTRPESNFTPLLSAFADNVILINKVLEQWNAMLMPSAAHPLMNPFLETKLWPHDSNEVYEIFNRIFDCKGHGWSNLQSTHLNLPFYDDEEFARLHAAVRVVLPLLPALCASSPILEGKLTGSLDTRLNFYKTNQSRIPSITGKVIPEAIFSKRNYLNSVYDKIKADLAPWDPEGILNPIWVNSRGAIPRFDRGSIEIRIMDIQECPLADLAIVELVIETVKALANGRFVSLEEQMKQRTETLSAILDDTTRIGQKAIIRSSDYLSAFGVSNIEMNAAALWQHIIEQLRTINPAISQWQPEISVILTEGTLADRLIRSMGTDTSQANIKTTYRKLCSCLAQNKMFIP